MKNTIYITGLLLSSLLFFHSIYNARAFFQCAISLLFVIIFLLLLLKKKQRKFLIVFTIMFVLLRLFTPSKYHVNDGGSIHFNAPLYKVIVWHQVNPEATKNPYLTGTSFYFFPKNFGTKEYPYN